MATYECSNCGMAVNATCAKCDALLVDDIGAWGKYLQSASIQTMPRKVRPDGAYQIFVVDPDGHCVEFCTGPVHSVETQNS